MIYQVDTPSMVIGGVLGIGAWEFWRWFWNLPEFANLFRRGKKR